MRNFGPLFTSNRYILTRIQVTTNVQSNPYIPSYLSPRHPGIGKEYRLLTRQLSLILNIAFSIIGSAAAVYVAATTGGGFKRETGVILGVLAGVVVGIADGVLVWIFKERSVVVKKEREEMGMRMGRGSGALGPKLKSVEGGEGGDGSLQRDSGDASVELATEKVNNEMGVNDIPAGIAGGEQGSSAIDADVEPEKRAVRLRRRALGERHE